MSSLPPPLRVVGEAVADIVREPDGHSRTWPGGSPANVAVGLGRLGHRVRLATRLGRDPLGGELERHLRESAVELVPGCTVPSPTSTAVAELDGTGAARYTFDIRWELTEQAAAAVRADGPGHLHTGSIATALEPGAARVRALVAAEAAAATVSYDPNLRPSLLGPADEVCPEVERLVAVSDVVKASEEDLDWLYPGTPPETAAAKWAQTGPALTVLTRGAAGATAFWPGGQTAVPPVRVTVTDTVGAGDSFMSALLSGLLTAGLLGGVAARAALRAALSGPEPHPAVTGALRLGSRAAALTCTRPGANPPTRAELD